ncbi:MAG TPA: hypothetical protein PLX97_15930, partial [Gemmatales bacterium]|nr:hypothetical protein [Gemmatales bacterium]
MAGTLLKPLLIGTTVVLLVIGGIGLSMLPLVAATPSQTVFPQISVLHPIKQAADVCGYVDDHEGKPLAGVKVEVVRDSKVETTLTTDAVGRFVIPDEWKSNRTVNRILIVRTKWGLGWSSRLNYGSRPLQQDIMITVLPLTAQVQATVSMKPAGRIQQNQMGWFQHVQNGSLNALEVPPGMQFFQNTVKEDIVTFQIPIHTTGTLFVNGQNHIGQRIQYSARGPGRCDLGTIGLKVGASISGTLVDDSGKTVHNAQLMAQSCHSAETNSIMHGTGAICHSDAAGHFSLDGLDERCEFNVMLVHPILQQNNPVPLVLSAVENVKLKQGESTRLKLQLQPAKHLKGRMM